MEKQADHSMRNRFSDHFRHEKEVIVVYPDCIALFVLTYDDISKSSVDFDVVLPAFVLPGFHLWVVRDLIME